MTLQLFVVLGCGLFAMGTIGAAARSRTWPGMKLVDFKSDFARTIVVADKIQPALALFTLAAIVSSVIWTREQGESYLIAAGVTLATIIAISVVVLVPLQRRIIDRIESDDLTVALRRRWMRGHFARMVAALVSFALTIIALAV
jgi:hypothetical protein